MFQHKAFKDDPGAGFRPCSGTGKSRHHDLETWFKIQQYMVSTMIGYGTYLMVIGVVVRALCHSLKAPTIHLEKCQSKNIDRNKK